MNEQLKKLHFRMKCTCFFLYFFRNNPRYTNRYYYRFIEIIGPDNFLNFTTVKNEWDGARSSFDKMYGLISAWKESLYTFDNELCELKKSLNSLLTEINFLEKYLNSCEKELITKLKSSDDEKSKELLSRYVQLKNALLLLNEEKENKDKTELSVLVKEINKAKSIIALQNKTVELSK